jgi:hypothetical protein
VARIDALFESLSNLSEASFPHRALQRVSHQVTLLDVKEIANRHDLLRPGVDQDRGEHPMVWMYVIEQTPQLSIRMEDVAQLCERSIR